MLNKTQATAKLYLLVGVMSIFIIGIGVYGIIQVKTMHRYAQTLYADRVLPLEQLTKVRYDYLAGIIFAAEQVQTHHLSYKKAIESILHAEEDITVNWEAYMQTYLTPQEAISAKEASGLITQSTGVIQKLRAILHKEDIRALDNFINTDLYLVVNPVIAKMNELINLQVSVGREIFINSTKVYNRALKQFIFLIILSLLFVLPFSYYLVRSVKYLVEDLFLSNTNMTKSEEKFRSLIEHAGDAIFLIGADTAVIDINRSACTLMGYTRHEFLSMKAPDLYPPGELEMPPVECDGLKKDKTILHERRFQKKDGTKADVEISMKMLADASGYLAIVRDITERKKTEVQLNEYKYFFYHSNDLSSIANVQGYWEKLNPRFEKLLGYTEEEMLQNQFFSFIHPEDISATRLEIQNLTSGGASINFGNRYRKKNGEYVWLEWNTTSDPVTGKLYAIARDITERKHTLEILRESERKYRSIFENVQDVFYQTNLEGIILEASPSIQSHTGFCRGDIIGTPVKNLYYNPSDRDKGINLLKQRGWLTDYELMLRSTTGEPVHVSLNARLIPAEDGSLSHIDGVFRNITERKRMEAELIESREQLKLFIAHSPASLAMFDNEMRYIATSRRWMNDYDLGEQQLVGKTHYEVFPEIPEHWKDIHRRCLRGEIAKNEEDTFTRANGREEWLRWEIHPWHKGNGEIGGIIIFTEVITERKRASELFKRQFENSPDIILIINKKFEIESINRGIPEGLPARDLIGLNAIELLPAESREAAGNAIMTCFATGQNQEIEGALRFGNWARSRFVPIIYHEGAITHIMIISTDITERKKTAEKIIRSEARLKEAQAIAHIGNWEIDMVNNVQRWSGGLYKILGTNKEETQASTDMLLSFIHDDDSGNARQQVREAFATLRDAAVNFRLIQKNGSIKYARIEWKFEFDAHAHPIRLYGIVQDITERRKAEETIKQSEANYRQMFNLSPAPMLLIDEETNRFVQVNQACVDQYGYSEAAFRGMTIDQINPQNDGKPEKDISTKKNMPDNDFMGAGRHIKKSGEIMEVISSSIPVILNGKKHLLLVVTDVTEKNLYEQKLTRAAIKAQEEEKYEIGGELHDNVCQILATSLITLGMMKKKLPGESRAYFDQTREYISLASKELRNLSHRLAPAFIDDATLEDAFDGLLKNFNINNKYNIVLDFNHYAKAYPLGRELQLNLYRVLQEQLGNISKYANATAIEVAVSITDHKLQMRITDNGVGFDADSIKGGIGLANMNRRVRLFSGSFRIDAAVGNGCTIIVVIPLSNAN